MTDDERVLKRRYRLAAQDYKSAMEEVRRAQERADSAERALAAARYAHNKAIEGQQGDPDDND